MKRSVLLSLVLVAATLFFARPVRSEEPRPVDLRRDRALYVVAVPHLDTQWRWTVQDTIRGYIPGTLRYNFRLFEKYPHYVLGWEGAWRYMLAKEYYPREYAKLKGYVAAGRWFVSGATLDSCDVNLPSPESLLRQIVYGNAFFRREFARTSCDVFLTDSFGYGFALPTIARHAGLCCFTTQKLTWGSAAGIPFDLGVWEGVDGSELAAALNPGNYMTEIHEDLSRSPEWLARIEHEGQQSGVFAALMFYGVGDRGGAPLEKSVEWLEKSIAGTGPIRVVSSPPDALFRTLAPDQIARLPRYRGELLLTTHGTGVYTSQAAMKRWNRRNELLADAAERASVVADWLGGSPYPRGKLTEAWTRFLWHQFHDDLPGTCIPRAYTISWNDEIISLNQFSEVAADAAGAVARGLDTRGEGATVVVYNPLSILREDPVEALVRMPGHMPPAVRVYDAEGHEVASQVLGTEGDAVRILFLAEVAPVGFAVYDVRAAETPCALQTGLRVSESSVENDRYVVRISPGGDVSSLRDKEANRELLAGPLRLQMFDDRSITWPAWEIMRSDIDAAPRRLVGGPAKVRIVENGPARVALEIEREVEGSTFIQRVRLASGGSEARVEFDTTLQWKSLGTLLKATFPLTVANPLATYDLGWGAVERTTNTPKLYEVPAQQWADITDPDGTYGVAVLNDCKYGWDKPADQTLRLTLLHTPVTGPESYTDQATQDIGRHRLLYAVCGHKGDWRSAVPWEAARMNQPLLAFQAPMHEGPLGKTFSLVSLDTPQVAVRAIKKAELTDEVIIRLVETAGRPAQDVHVSFCGGLLGAREVNGSEQPVGPAAIEDGDLVADFTPYQPRTFAVKLTAPPARLEAPVSRPLPLALDLDVVSADNEQKGGDFDGSGHAIPAELWPPAIVSEGIQFALGSRAAGTKNALACTGQQIALPQGTHQHLYLLAAAAGPDDVKAAFLVDDRPVDLTIQSWTGLVGQWDSRVVGGQVVEDLSRIAPAFLKRDPIAWVGTHRHDKDGKNEPYVFCYLFKYRIEVPKNAATLTLPKNDRLRIFAATLVTNPNDDTRPAQWLYD